MVVVLGHEERVVEEPLGRLEARVPGEADSVRLVGPLALAHQRETAGPAAGVTPRVTIAPPRR